MAQPTAKVNLHFKPKLKHKGVMTMSSKGMKNPIKSISVKTFGDHMPSEKAV